MGLPVVINSWTAAAIARVPICDARSTSNIAEVPSLDWISNHTPRHPLPIYTIHLTLKLADNLSKDSGRTFDSYWKDRSSLSDHDSWSDCPVDQSLITVNIDKQTYSLSLIPGNGPPSTVKTSAEVLWAMSWASKSISRKWMGFQVADVRIDMSIDH